MSAFIVHVTIGPGAWARHREVTLCAAPHVGDGIIVGEVTVICEKVYIDLGKIYVKAPHHFSTLEDAEEYETLGWKP